MSGVSIDARRHSADSEETHSAPHCGVPRLHSIRRVVMSEAARAGSSLSTMRDGGPRRVMSLARRRYVVSALPRS